MVVMANSKKRKGVTIGVEYELEIRDKHGKLLSKVKGLSHSFVKHFILILRAMAYGGTTKASLTDTAGNGRQQTFTSTASQPLEPLDINGEANDDTHGIVVGDSDIAFDKLQYNLQGKISHGSGAGQLVYNASTVESVTDTDNESYFRVIRTFTNNSGATITVKEIGIVARAHYDGNTWYFLIARDVLASPQSVPDGASLTVRYRIYITYS